MKFLFVPALIAAFVLGLAISRVQPNAAVAASENPTTGWTIHIDAQKHFPGHPDEIAHHWCKSVAGMLECQVYDSDAANAHLVEVETILPKSVYATLPASEQALWHYHRVEIPKINATMPDVSKAEAAKTVASLLETYGKVWMLWDPATSQLPLGKPIVVVLK